MLGNVSDYMSRDWTSMILLMGRYFLFSLKLKMQSMLVLSVQWRLLNLQDFLRRTQPVIVFVHHAHAEPPLTDYDIFS